MALPIGFETELKLLYDQAIKGKADAGQDLVKFADGSIYKIRVTIINEVVSFCLIPKTGLDPKVSYKIVTGIV